MNTLSPPHPWSQSTICIVLGIRSNLEMTQRILQHVYENALPLDIRDFSVLEFWFAETNNPPQTLR